MKPVLVALALSLACTSAYAQQQPAPKIVTLHKSPVSGQPDKEFLLLSIEWPAEAADPNLTTRATQPRDRLAGWAYRIRTAESGRGLPDWICAAFTVPTPLPLLASRQERRGS
jgi:hypothetical protein